MHPVIARFLSLDNAVAALEKADQALALDAGEAALARAAALDQRARAAILSAKGKRRPPPRAEEALVALSTRAAVELLAGDAVLGPAAAAARSALAAQGASEDECTTMVAGAVLDEAFAYAADPTEFDAAYLAETLAALVPLAKVTSETLDAWQERFVQASPPGARPLALQVAEALLDAAWGEGPQPIAPEHVDDALERLLSGAPSSEAVAIAAQAQRFLDFLAAEGVVGPERRRRLASIVTLAAADLGSPRGDDDEAAEDTAEAEDGAGD